MPLAAVNHLVTDDKDVIAVNGQLAEYGGAHTVCAAQPAIGLSCIGIYRLCTFYACHMRRNLVAPYLIGGSGEVQLVIRHAVGIGSHIQEVVPQVDVGDVLLFAQCFECLIGCLQGLHGTGSAATEMAAGQQALDVDSRLGSHGLQTLHHEGDVAKHMLGGADACCAEVVGTHHDEYLLGLTGSHGFDVGQCLVGDSPRHTAVHHVVVAEGFPPLVHVGDAVTDEYCLLRVDGQYPERIVTMVAERSVGKDCGDCT